MNKLKFSQMSEGAWQAVKSAVAGIAIGTTTGVVGDAVFQKLVMPILKPPVTPNSGGGALAQMALSAMVTGATGGLIVYGGNQVFEMVAGNDFFGHLVFYQSCFFTSATIQGSALQIKAILNAIVRMNQTITNNPPSAPQAPVPPPSSAPSGENSSELFVNRPGQLGCLKNSGCMGNFNY